MKEAFILGEWWHSDSALDVTTGIPLSNDTSAGVWQTHAHTVPYAIWLQEACDSQPAGGLSNQPEGKHHGGHHDS